MFRRIFSVVLVGVLGILVPDSAAASTGGSRSGADIAVGLDASGGVLLASARYDVTVTNNGPETLTSATVIVQLDPRAAHPGGSPPQCPMDTTADTLTCSFGPLGVGATTTLSTWVFFSLPPAYLTVYATATRTASTPTDPDPSNDSATTPCGHGQSPGGFPPNQWRLYC